MKLIDTHCHLQGLDADLLFSILENAKTAHITNLICASTSRNDWNECITLSNTFKQINTALGIHPWHINKEDKTFLNNNIEDIKKHSIAIGEIGLDKKLSKVPLEIQIEIFEHQLKIARELNLPVIIHCVGAYNELLISIKKIGISTAGGIIHSYSKSIDLSKQLIKYGFCFSFGKYFSHNLSKKQIELIKFLYPNYFLLESDSFPAQNILNNIEIVEPTVLTFFLQTASKILNLNVEKIAETTTLLANQKLNIK